VGRRVVVSEFMELVTMAQFALETMMKSKLASMSVESVFVVVRKSPFRRHKRSSQSRR
jgi:hypothetical protein